MILLCVFPSVGFNVCFCLMGEGRPHAVLFVFTAQQCVRLKQSWRLLSFFVLFFYCVLVCAPV